MSLTGYSIVPSGGVLGADVLGFDTSLEPDAKTMESVRASFAEHGVLCFRDQRLTEKQLVAFTQRFGETESYVPVSYTHLRAHET